MKPEWSDGEISSSFELSVSMVSARAKECGVQYRSYQRRTAILTDGAGGRTCRDDQDVKNVCV